MGRVLNTIALTLVGAGMLAASGTLDDSSRLYDEVLSRARTTAGIEVLDGDAIRAALRDDRAFALRIDDLRLRTLAFIRDARFGEDAFQEAFLKTWRGRPEMFLKGDDELLRYLRAATRKNLLTMLGKSAREHVGARGAETEVEELADARATDPLAALSAEDLAARLVERLSPAGRAVLALRRGGAHSDRRVAAATGASRHAVQRVTEDIRRELARLLGEGCESAA